MTNILDISWIIVSLILMVLIILREPNVESVGAIIQESQYKDNDSEKRIDKIILGIFLTFIMLTVFLFLELQ
jgi:preprotein translocase subunit SecG